jgi:hypothetical protein
MSEKPAGTSVLPSSARTSRPLFTTDPPASQPVQSESDGGQRRSVDIGLNVGVAVGGTLGLAAIAGMAVLVRRFRASSPRVPNADEGTGNTVDGTHSETVFASPLPPLFDSAIPTHRERELWNFSDDFGV